MTLKWYGAKIVQSRDHLLIMNKINVKDLLDNNKFKFDIKILRGIGNINILIKEIIFTKDSNLSREEREELLITILKDKEIVGSKLNKLAIILAIKYRLNIIAKDVSSILCLSPDQCAKLFMENELNISYPTSNIQPYSFFAILKELYNIYRNKSLIIKLILQNADSILRHYFAEPKQTMQSIILLISSLLDIISAQTLYITLMQNIKAKPMSEELTIQIMLILLIDDNISKLTQEIKLYAYTRNIDKYIQIFGRLSDAQSTELTKILNL